jgi:precorrin-6A/cobalt-precorrin-6A reductase
VRPAWAPQPGDAWQSVPTAVAAALALGREPRRVFLSLGRQELHFFAAIQQHHYIARLIEPPRQTALPHKLDLLQQRGPFDRDAELRLLRDHKINVIVSKNSGGSATYPKIEAARVLGLPVIMIARPAKPAGHIVKSAEAAMAWLAHDGAPRSLRGV